MGAGIPMYYLTAHSRAQSAGKGYSRVEKDDDGVRAILRSKLADLAPTDFQRHGTGSRSFLKGWRTG
jgi:hypothetical protein